MSHPTMTEAEIVALFYRVEAAAAAVRRERREYMTASISIANFPEPVPVDCAFAPDGPEIVKALYDAAFPVENRALIAKVFAERRGFR